MPGLKLDAAGYVLPLILQGLYIKGKAYVILNSPDFRLVETDCVLEFKINFMGMLLNKIDNSIHVFFYRDARRQYRGTLHLQHNPPSFTSNELQPD